MSTSEDEELSESAPRAGEPAHGATDPRYGAEPVAHVLLVDDDERIRQLLRRFLEKNGYIVTCARDAAHARGLVAALAFDILIVDVMMPGEDGLSFTRWIDGRTPVLLLTARGELESRIEGLEAGADDYLSKPFEPRELKLRMEAILRRSAAPPPPSKAAVIRLGGLRFDASRGELWRGDEEVRLTTAEVTIMRLFARRANQPVSRADLLAELGADPDGGEDKSVQERAVDVQITRLRRKVEETPRSPRYIKTVRGAGYMLSPDGESAA